MKPNEIDEQLLLKLYNEDLLSIVKCAEILKVSESCIRRRLKKLKIVIRSPGEQLTHQDITKEQVVELYLNQGLSIAQCAAKLNKSEGFVKKRLKMSGVKIRSVIEGLRVFHKTDNITDDEIIDLYENKKMSTYEISKHFNKSPYFARQRLWQISYPMRDNAGENNGSWKGGITTLHSRIRTCKKMETWKVNCLRRDDYQCQISGSPDDVQVHHYPITFAEIFDNFLRKYPDLSPINDCDKLLELSQNHDPFWDINNGITISKEEHKKLHNPKGITNNIKFAIKFYKKELKQEEINSIIGAYERGDRIKDIRRNFNLGAMRIYSILRENNINPANRINDQRSDATKQSERVIQLYKDGTTVKELAKMYEVSDTTIRKILKK